MSQSPECPDANGRFKVVGFGALLIQYSSFEMDPRHVMPSIEAPQGYQPPSFGPPGSQPDPNTATYASPGPAAISQPNSSRAATSSQPQTMPLNSTIQQLVESKAHVHRAMKTISHKTLLKNELQDCIDNGIAAPIRHQEGTNTALDMGPRGYYQDRRNWVTRLASEIRDWEAQEAKCQEIWQVNWNRANLEAGAKGQRLIADPETFEIAVIHRVDCLQTQEQLLEAQAQLKDAHQTNERLRRERDQLRNQLVHGPN